MRALLRLPHILVSLSILSIVGAAQDAPWIRLFGEDSLAGWSAVGSITCSVEDGAVRIEGGLGYLVHERPFADFELEFEVLSESSNSGVQIRSELLAGGRMAGYQIEVDPSERAWSGGLYEAEGRLWLQDLEGRPEAQAAWRPGEWNAYRVRCAGAHIQSWLNGTPCADMLDAERLRGSIGLQGHDAGGLVRFRNVRVRDLGQSRWEPLWDGESTRGWHAAGEGAWSIEEGVLVGTHAAAVREYGHLVSDAVFDNFTLRARWRSLAGNSGLYFRVEETGFSGIAGFQAEIDPVRDVGGLYETNGRAWVVKPSAEELATYFRPQDWNTTVVSALDARVAVAVNGTRTAELFDDPGRRRGHLALQLHGGQDVRVEFSSVELLRSYPPGVLELPHANERAARETRTLDTTTEWEPPDSRERWEERRAQLRTQVLVAAGLEPLPARPPLEPLWHGRVEREGYVVERVAFESFPGYYVTGSLYRPTDASSGARPAVLCPHGHWADGRFSVRSDEDVQAELDNGGEVDPVAARYHLQARMVQLARMGCVVFHYDMLGYADAIQLGVGHAEGFADDPSISMSLNPLGLQLFNSIRALDFVESLPDVDPERIAVTGGSGGGTQTFLLCAVDERPALSAPAVMVSMRMQGGCPCENASHLRLGTNNVELAALFAPKPLLLIGADDWTLHIEEEGGPELRALWDLYGREDAFAVHCHPEFPHNYNRTSRAHLYAWLNEHFELGAELEERPFEPLSPAELSVWTDEHPLPEDAVDLEGLKRVWGEHLEGALRSRADALRDPSTTPWLDALQVLVHGRLPAADPERAAALRSTEPGPSVVRIAAPELDTTTTAWLWTPPDWSGRTLIAATDEGPLAFARLDADGRSLAQGVLEQGCALLALGPPAPEHVARDGWRHERYPGFTWGYNRTPLAERTLELLNLIALARDWGGEQADVRLWTSGSWSHARPLVRLLAAEAVAHSAGDPYELSEVSAQLPGFWQVWVQWDAWRESVHELDAADPLELAGR